MPIFEKIKSLFEANSPFACYQKPNENQWNLVQQETNDLHLFSGQSGFLFMPFNEGNQVVLPFDSCLFSSGTLERISKNNTENNEKRTNLDAAIFENLVQLSKNEIAKNTFKKVVVSRKIAIQNPISIVETFEKMLLKYPAAFRYLFFHPKIGLWMGATPEQLLKTNNATFETVSLAGTQLYKEDLQWSKKEIDEQQFVTDYILSELGNHKIEAKVIAYETSKAGNLAHIKARITGVLPQNKSVFEVLSILHPTPAVCGFPKERALDFILKNEAYQRTYYSGFLGEFDKENQSDLYVNLRCLEITPKNSFIYVGCGITKDSDPKLEYQETQNKAETMRSILVYK